MNDGRLRWWRSGVFFAGLTIVGTVAVVAVLAPVLAPYDPRALAGQSLRPPSGHHLLGTNDIGQDIFSELVWGARSSVAVAVGAASLAVLLGVAVGVAAGLFGGWVDVVAMRAVDVFLAVPVLPLLILVAAVAGRDRLLVTAMIGLLGWPPMARVVRSQALTLRQRGFVTAARGFGGGPLYLVRRHLVPALGPLLVTRFVEWAGLAVFIESGLAFLGLGDPVGVSWGMILNRALDHKGLYFSSAWTWWVLPAGLAISLTVLGFTFLGVGLEPSFNPRWRRGV